MQIYNVKSRFRIRLYSNVTSKLDFCKCRFHLFRRQAILKFCNNRYLPRISILLKIIDFDFAEGSP